MTTQDLGPILARLDRLDRQNRRLWRGLLAAVAALVVVGGVAARGVADKTVEASEFVLKDPAGTVRWRVAYDAKDGVVQTLSDANGKDRLRLLVDQDGVSRIRIFDDAGTIRVGAFAYPKEHKDKDSAHLAGVVVSGPGDGIDPRSGKGGIEITAEKDCSASIDAISPKKDVNTGIKLGTTAEGLAYQVWFGPNSNRRVAITSQPEGDAGLFLMDKDGKDRGHLVIARNGIGGLALLDENQKTRIKSWVIPKGTGTTGPSAEGFATYELIDAAGRLRADSTTYNNGQVSSDHYDTAGHLRMSNVVFGDGNAFHKQFDPKGQLRMYTGTYSNGESGHAVLGRNGGTKFSTAIKGDDSLSFYVEKNAASQAWDAYQNVRNVVQLGQDLKTIYDLIK